MAIMKVREYNAMAEPEDRIRLENGKERETGWLGSFNGVWQWYPNKQQARAYHDGYRTGRRLPANKMRICSNCGVSVGEGMPCSQDCQDDLEGRKDEFINGPNRPKP